MKVLERIKQIRAIVKNGTNIEKELVQLEAEIVEALQKAKQEGWDAGHRWRLIEEMENTKDNAKVCRACGDSKHFIEFQHVRCTDSIEEYEICTACKSTFIRMQYRFLRIEGVK